MNKFWFMVVSLTMFVFLHINSYGQIITGDSLDPNVLWKTDDSLGGFTGFQIHPSGNLIANHNCEFFEIDGKTGQRIRSFPVIYGYSGVSNATTISKNGRYFAAGFDGTGRGGTTNDIYIFDYATGSVVKQLKNYGEALYFLNDSKRLVIRAYKGSLTIYDIEKDTSYYNDAKMFVQIITVSDDGKFIATGGVSLNYDGKQYSIIKLWDATTLKQINEYKLEEGTRDLLSLKFSSDSKYVAAVLYIYDLYIYRTDDFSLFKHYNKDNTANGVYGFCFIDNNYIGMKSDKTYIVRLSDDKTIFSSYTFMGPKDVLEFNKSNNTLVVAAVNLIAYDLNKIMTTVKDDSKNQKFTITFSNNILSIDNLVLVSTNPKITISDINGKIIRQMDLSLSNGGIKIPIKLISGTYLIDITDGKKQYSSKFIVEN